MHAEAQRDGPDDRAAGHTDRAAQIVRRSTIAE